MRVLFVCLGNICRSPLAEAYFAKLVRDSDLGWEVDSAGTSSWHVGEPPHSGTVKIGLVHGLVFDGQVSRKISKQDFAEFDALVAMDRSNYEDLIYLHPESEYKIHLLLDYANGNETDVHDPYYDRNFELMYEQVAAGCDGLLEYLRNSQ